MASRVAQDEYILRRAHESQRHPNAPYPLTLGVFTPNKADTDGLSVFRESYVTPEQLKESGRKPPEEYVVVRLPVALLTKLGLTVVPKDDDALPGHCIIPELKLSEYKANKAHLKQVQARLLQGAEEVSRPAENECH